MSKKWFGTVVRCVAIVLLCYGPVGTMHEGHVLHALDDHEGECEDEGGERCSGCRCHRGHSNCAIDHATVCSGGGCSRHSNRDCSFSPLAD